MIIDIVEPKTVAFETNGGSAVESQTVYKGYPAVRPANPARMGYEFSGWFEDNGTFTREWNFNTVPERNLTLYARWAGGVVVTVTGPVTGDIPVTTALAGSGGAGAAHYTCGPVTWTPAHNPFQGSTQYTATVTLTAVSGYTFDVPASATMNGNPADITANTATSVTLEYTFAPTGSKAVAAIAVSAQPTKTAYTHSEALDLSGLVVTVTYNDGTTDAVPFANFASNNISASPAHGDILSVLSHDGQPVVVSLGSHQANTAALTVADAEARIGTTYYTLAAAISAAANGSLASPTEIVIVKNITAAQNGTNNYAQRIPANKNIKLTVDAGTNITITAASGAFALFDVSNTGSSLTLEAPSGASLTLSGNNTAAASHRRGVFVSGNATLVLNSGVTITGFTNTGLNIGSGVYVLNGTFTMSGGTISGNTASIGGGVCIEDNTAGNSAFAMSGGTISGNTASTSGGGVSVGAGSTFTMSGGTVYGTNETDTSLRNNASSSGASVYVGGTAQYGGAYGTAAITTTNDTLPAVSFSSVSANGSATTANTTQLTLTFSRAIPGLSAADIALSGVSGVTKGTLSGSGPSYTLGISGFTSGGTLTVTVAKSGYTVSGSPRTAAIYYTDPEARITATEMEYVTLSAALTDAANGSLTSPTEIVILKNITSASGYSIPAGKNIKLTVETAKNITITAAAGAFNLFSVPANGSLTLGTTPSGASLTLSGNNAAAADRRGVYANGGTIVLNSGVTITAFNSSVLNGGGVYSTGTFTMNGGTISNNNIISSGTSPLASYCGGGVYSTGTFTMSGGTISNNTVTADYTNGGGVYSAGTFTMSGGTISGNQAIASGSAYGGGVYLGGTSTFTMSGTAAITGNTAKNTISGNYYAGGGGVDMGGGSSITAPTFLMLGGTISGNVADAYATTLNSGAFGGGVSVSTGSFQFVSGTIYGNSSGSNSNNVISPVYSTSALHSAALYVYTATAQRGTYSGSVFTPTGTLSSTDSTIP